MCSAVTADVLHSIEGGSLFSPVAHCTRNFRARVQLKQESVIGVVESEVPDPRK
jgi:hypothetical protein